MNDDIEKIVEDILMRRGQVALALELPESVYDGYTKWLADTLRQALHQAQQQEWEAILALRPERIEIEDDESNTTATEYNILEIFCEVRYSLEKGTAIRLCRPDRRIISTMGTGRIGNVV